MYWLGSCSVLLLCLAALGAAKNTYVITAPGKFWPDTPYSVQVTILKSSSPVRVTATLVGDGNTLATASKDFEEGSPGRLTMSVGAQTYGVYALRVEGSGGLTFRNETTVSYGTKSYSVLIQTDKAIYKPGQMVRFRAFSINSDLLPMDKKYQVEIFDGKNNKIRKWAELSNSTSRVIQGSLQLSDHPVLGAWRIRVTPEGSTDYEEKEFEVQEYVLPKFEVTLSLPPYYVLDGQDLRGRVGAKYTYGEDVAGKATVQISYMGNTVETTVDVNGDRDFVISAEDITRLRIQSSFSQNTQTKDIAIVAKVKETLTGLEHNTSSTLKVSRSPYILAVMKSTPTVFRPGLTFTTYLKYSRPDGSGVKQEEGRTVVARVAFRKQGDGFSTNTETRLDSIFSIPPGIVEYSFEVPENTTSFTVTAEDRDDGKVQVNKRLDEKFESPTDSGLQVLIDDQDDEEIEFELRTTEVVQSVIYQIVSRGDVLQTAAVPMNGKTSETFTVPLSADMAPSPSIIAFYTRRDGEIVSDSIGFSVQGAMRNKVSLEFSAARAQPRDPVTLKVEAEPLSYVGLLAVDKSVLLLKTGNDITEDDVVEALREYDIAERDEGDDDHHPMAMERRRKKRQARGGAMMVMPWFPSFSSATDAAGIFKKAGLKVMTDALLYSVPKRDGCPECGFGGGVPMFEMAAGMPGDEMDGAPLPMTSSGDAAAESGGPTVRKLFPEAWLWRDEAVGADGRLAVDVTMPDTITSWVASAFALHPTVGLGIADTASIEGFKNFFISAKLPYNLVKGEEFDLQASLFNYMSQALTVDITLKGSPDLSVLPAAGPNDLPGDPVTNQDVTMTVTVPAGKAAAAVFSVAPLTLGRITISLAATSPLAGDAVERSILVKPEGSRVDFSYGELVKVKDGEPKTLTQPLAFPGAVPGSVVMHVQVVGDIMGPVLENLDSLLMMPTGCGEQTMLTMAPNIFIMQYLDATQQVNPDIRDKATKFMLSGYQRELTYTHSDGSFSAFGESDDSGSTWLTAFVVKSFQQADTYITLDENVIARGAQFLKNHQSPDGSFREPGRVIHKDMQGGNTGVVTLSAFITAALIEGGEPASDPKVAKGLSYLAGKVDGMKDPYTLAVITYALVLGGHAKATEAIAELDKHRIDEKDGYHWERPSSKDEPSASAQQQAMWHYPAPSASVEMTAYALMIYSRADRLADAAQVVQWLTRQRNQFGGFSSTQNTVIGLQALSIFAAKARSEEFRVKVETNAGGGLAHTFNDITADNSMVLQKWMVENAGSVNSVETTVSGEGVALVQVSGFYHVTEKDNQVSKTKVVVKTQPFSNNAYVDITACGSGDAGGMPLMEVSMLSGYSADLTGFSKPDGMKRIEVSDDGTVVTYWDEFGDEQSCVTVRAVKTEEVRDLKPAQVKASDYYNQMNVYRAEYSLGSGIEAVDCSRKCTTQACLRQCPTGVASSLTRGVTAVLVTCLAAWLLC